MTAWLRQAQEGEPKRDASDERWMADLRAAASQPRPADVREAAMLRSRVQTALLALVPAIRRGAMLGPLPPLAPWLAVPLVDTSTDSLYYLAGGQIDCGLQPIYQRMADRQAAFTAEIVGVLASSGIVPLVVKGSELRARLFGGRGLSNSTDVDLLVAADAVEPARRALLSHGLAHADLDVTSGCLIHRTTAEVAAHEQRHYELYPLCRVAEFPVTPEEAAIAGEADLEPLFVRGGHGRMLEVIDLHRTLFVNVEAATVISRAVPSVFAGAMTLSPTDHAWTTALRFYLESASTHDDPKQRDLAYLAALIDEGGIDWELLVDIVGEADLRPALFYTLRLLDRLGVGAVPPFVFNALHVRRGSIFMDFGCRATRALGHVEELPALVPVASDER